MSGAVLSMLLGGALNLAAATFNTSGAVGSATGTYTVPSKPSVVVLHFGAQYPSPGGEPTAVTISGRAATKIASTGVTVNTSSLWAVLVQPGDPNTWSVTTASVFSSRCLAQLYTVSTTNATPTSTATSTATNPTATLNVPNGGCFIGGCSNQATATYSWSLLSVDNTQVTNLHGYSCAHKNYAGLANSQTETVTISGSLGSAGVFAVFGP